ncbi:ankyrin-2-like [Trichogramma pretiosum]|uniref:ankyrin-2-like n=1 Tax=Trichogramma pretiosum TaxID=7493 RepID=UPI000C71A360|nr:ankyrin-2-like [Trichogramma pretiosum]
MATNNDWLGSEKKEEIISNLMFRTVSCGMESEIVIQVMNSLYPSVGDKKNLLKSALVRRCLKMIKLIEADNLKIHEVRFEDGHSALHYLAEVIYKGNDEPLSCEGNLKVLTLRIMDYLLESPEKNYQDNLGYTYLHGACMSGNVSAVNLLLSQGVDVNLDTYTCSPLHLAAQYRHAEVVEILLTHGANPNQRDAEESTPLHALARLCLCQCTDCEKFCDKRKPVDKLVQMLIDNGADIEARNCQGYTPLGLSVSRLDLELTRTFLKYGAKIDNLNENKIFNMTFTPLELKNYPLTLNIIEMTHLLKSAGYNLSLQARLRMIKYWMKIRGNDTDHLISDDTESSKIFNKDKIEKKIFFHDKYGFHLTQKAEGFLRQKCEELRNLNPSEYHRFFPREAINDLTAQVERTKNIMLSENVSLYQMCRMSYSNGYSLIKDQI